MEQQALAEGFRGITASGTVQPGIFPIKATGVSTEPVAAAARVFLESLSDEQLQRTQFASDDDEWRKWANQHSYPRQGVSFEEMSTTQRLKAFALIAAGMSACGLGTTKDIMKLNGTLGELTGRTDEYGEWLYHMTIMGEPSATEPWGWQLDGHHVVVNYFILGDQVVMTPQFLGSEPVRADSGKFEGTVILQEEQAAAIAFAESLDKAELAQATIAPQKSGTNALTEAFKDNHIIDYAGIPASKLDATKQEALVQLAGHFIGQMADDHAKVKLSEIREHLDQTYFGWIGESSDDGAFYFRIHSPVVLIEFDHQRPIALGRDGIPTRNHIHAVVRTPNGNDYGKDLLRQHLLEEHGGE